MSMVNPHTGESVELDQVKLICWSCMPEEIFADIQQYGLKEYVHDLMGLNEGLMWLQIIPKKERIALLSIVSMHAMRHGIDKYVVSLFGDAGKELLGNYEDWA